jgi:hypothetical protein
LSAEEDVEEDWDEVLANRICLRRGARLERVSALVAVLEASIVTDFFFLQKRGKSGEWRSSYSSGDLKMKKRSLLFGLSLAGCSCYWDFWLVRHDAPFN